MGLLFVYFFGMYGVKIILNLILLGMIVMLLGFDDILHRGKIHWYEWILPGFIILFIVIMAIKFIN